MANLIKCCPAFQKMQNCIPTKDFTHLHYIKNKIFLIQNKLTTNMKIKHRQNKDNQLPINSSDVKHSNEKDVIVKSSFSPVAINH